MNADRISEYAAERRKNVKVRAKELWKAAKHRASVNGLDFTLSLARIEVCLMIGTCEGSGVRFDFDRHARNYYNPFAPSVDKTNPFGGYTDVNVKIVCNAYNLGKNQMSRDEYVEFCRNVVVFNDRPFS